MVEKTGAGQALNEIEQRRTQVHSPETNGFAKPFQRTIIEEFLAVTFRPRFYESVEQLQKHLDACLDFYNRERAHQGYRTRGRLPSRLSRTGNLTPLSSESPELESTRRDTSESPEISR